MPSFSKASSNACSDAAIVALTVSYPSTTLDANQRHFGLIFLPCHIQCCLEIFARARDFVTRYVALLVGEKELPYRTILIWMLKSRALTLHCLNDVRHRRFLMLRL